MQSEYIDQAKRQDSIKLTNDVTRNNEVNASENVNDILSDEIGIIWQNACDTTELVPKRGRNAVRKPK